MNKEIILSNYENAKQIYGQYGVDVENAIEKFKTIPISVHNWQGDDVSGFEGSEGIHSENVVTGNYPGRARNGDEMRQDLEQALKFSPSKHKLNLHSMYAEPKVKKERNEYDTEDYRTWIDWAKKNNLGIDFNVSYFTHPMMKDGCSLASDDENVREYWIKAGIAGRKVANDIGEELGQVCINNTWVPDGTKDIPADRGAYRKRLEESLDRILETPYDKKNMRDVIEGKVFGIGTESFVVGSHDFLLAYAIKNGIGITFDTGHYHPTEDVADKITAIHPFVESINTHLTRGVRWDSDHCLIQGDDLRNILLEIKRQDLFDKNVDLGLDYFDATINRVASWIIGIRAAGKTLLEALLEPSHLLKEAEVNKNLTKRLALMDEFKSLPANAVWDYLCMKEGKGVGSSWLDEMEIYEQEVQLKRD
ncbi:MAG: L-rhamnose isomerase [Clostridiales bacterium]|nr:L-rhamnose isomerase [Clostridiales bacterium]